MFEEDVGAPGEHQYLQDVAIYQKSENQVGQDYERSATTTRFVNDGNGHQGEVTEFEYESQETLEYPASFVIPKPVHLPNIAYSYTTSKPKY